MRIEVSPNRYDHHGRASWGIAVGAWVGSRSGTAAAAWSSDYRRVDFQPDAHPLYDASGVSVPRSVSPPSAPKIQRVGRSGGMRLSILPAVSGRGLGEGRIRIATSSRTRRLGPASARGRG